MSKLYPPYIENTLPAMLNNGSSFIVPFQLNKAVSRNEFSQVAIIIKTVQSNNIKVNGKFSTKTITYDDITNTYTAIFDFKTLNFYPIQGQYYKVQIAFVDKDSQEIGYYSNVGVIKCTTEPKVSIKDLDEIGCNQHWYEYTGIYSQKKEAGSNIEKDYAEKVYSYKFDLYDEEKQLIATSGEQLHNSSFDVERYESTDKWIVEKDLIPDNKYYIQYTVKTLNNLIVSSIQYCIVKFNSIDLDKLNTKLVATNEADDGYVCVKLVPSNKNDLKYVKGNFVLIRASSENNFETWHEIYRFELSNEIPDKHLWNDFSVAQGLTYRYAIQAYNSKNFYSNRLLSEDVSIDFEDCFLFDGKKQLKIKFNPKVSSFKKTILETKVDTLGGQHPFIFRNGRVEYREFPISGLISLISDPNELFIKDIQSAAAGTEREKTKSDSFSFGNDTDLSQDNFYRERIFKMEVLDWLTNGEPKLFRSASEGNYIVRLMNVSLTPNDTLGRMLHTFNCTAYEIAECTFSNLEKYGFIQGKEPAYKEIKVGVINILEAFKDENTYEFDNAVYYLRFENLFDYITFQIHYTDGSYSDEAGIQVSNTTGTYFSAGDVPIRAITLLKHDNEIPEDAIITFGYYEPSLENQNAYIENITVEDVIAQYIGTGDTVNIINTIKDGVRLETGRFYYISIQHRQLEPVYYNFNDKNYYFSDDYRPETKVTTWDPMVIYYFPYSSDSWIDGRYPPPSGASNEDFIRHDKISYKVRINNKDYLDMKRHPVQAGLEVAGRLDPITNIDKVYDFMIGEGLFANVVYQLKTIEYGIENTNQAVKDAKTIWLNNPTNENYQNYITKLKEALQREQGDLIYAI